MCSYLGKYEGIVKYSDKLFTMELVTNSEIGRSNLEKRVNAEKLIEALNHLFRNMSFREACIATQGNSVCRIDSKS